MNKFLSLMKISLIDQFNLNKLFKKEGVVSKVLVTLLISFVYILMMFYFGMMLYAIGKIDTSIGNELVLKIGLLASSGILIVTTLSRANAYLFRAKDFDLLSSLSIPLTTIVLVKISSFLLFSYISLSIVLIPTMIVFYLLGSFSIYTFFTSFIVFLLLPLIIISVFSIVSYLLAALLSRFKYRNVISIIFQLAFFVGIMLFSMSTNNINPESIATIFDDLDSILKIVYFPSYLASEALLSNYIYLLVYILSSVLVFGLFVYYTSKLYVYINSKLTSSVTKTVFKDSSINEKSSGTFVPLIKLELKKFLSVPIYVMNSLSSKLMAIIFVVFFYIQFSEGGVVSDDFNQILPLIILGISIFMMGMTTTTSSTISMEGKNFWILKTLPIKQDKILWSKIMIELIFSVITSLVVTILMLILGNVNIVLSILMFVLLVLFSIHNSIIGLLINLRYHKFDWDVPTKVVKQGTSVLLTMIIGMVFDGLIIGLMLVSIFLLSFNVLSTFLLLVLVLVIIVVLDILILNRLGNKLYNKI